MKAAKAREKMITRIVNRTVARRLGQLTFDSSTREAAKYSNNGFNLRSPLHRRNCGQN